MKLDRKKLREMIKDQYKAVLKQNMYKDLDQTILKIGNIAKYSPIVNMTQKLQQIFNKKDVEFTNTPVPHIRIKHEGKTILVANKRYAQRAQLVVNDIAIGYEGNV